VAIVILSTSVGLAGLLLVFFGFIFSAYDSFGFGTEPSLTVKYRILLGIIIFIFAICALTGILSLFWLVDWGTIPPSWILYPFTAIIIGVLALAIVTFATLVKR